MTAQLETPHDGQLRLAPESIEAIARAVAELLGQGAEASRPRRLLTAAEVSQWWGVERSWVYANAERLGARRLGAGQRPRLRFDPNEVAERLGSPDRPRGPVPPTDRVRLARIPTDSTQP